MNNGDRIRQMTNTEMANWLFSIGNIPWNYIKGWLDTGIGAKNSDRIQQEEYSPPKFRIKEAYDAGYRMGYERGYEEAYTETKEELAESLQARDKQIAALIGIIDTMTKHEIKPEEIPDCYADLREEAER